MRDIYARLYGSSTTYPRTVPEQIYYLFNMELGFTTATSNIGAKKNEFASNRDV
jgi:hypothetical protein